MSGSFTFGGGPAPLTRAGTMVSVFRYTPDGAAGSQFQPLPNVRCTDVEMSEGAEPGAARFRYRFDEILGDPGDPSRFEHVAGMDAGGPRVVRPDDRLCVYASGSGGPRLIFDGFVQIPQVDVGPRGEEVTFAALGTPCREWDTPLPGAYMRDMDEPDVASDVQTNLPARFNPDGHPNASPTGADSIEGAVSAAQHYPTFFGPIYPTVVEETKRPRAWTLGMAFRYLFSRGRISADGSSTTWVEIDDWSLIDDGLKSIVPKSAGGPVNWPDTSTFDLKPIIVQDLDVTGESWPNAVQKLLEPHGFTMFFKLTMNADFTPRWLVGIYRKDIPIPLKSLYLQAVPVEALDPGRSTLLNLRLARDSKYIKNRHVVDTAPIRYEASFICAPLFEVVAGDATDVRQFDGDQANAATAKYRKYREWGLDESGEGHWDGAAFVTGQYTALSELFPTPDLIAGEETGEGDESGRNYSRRRRKPIGDLITLGNDGKALRAELAVSPDYEGAAPGLYDGTGTWFTLKDAGWSPLPDRIGFRIDARKLDEVMAEVKPQIVSAVRLTNGGKVNLVVGTAAPTAENPRLNFRLTCCVDADNGIDAVANRRAASPTRFPITLRTDARDRFKKTIVSRFSSFNTNADEDLVVRDDTNAAKDHAAAMRRAGERAKFAGSATIGGFTDAYQLGDKIRGIEGRNLWLRTNAGGEQGESDTYPVVVGVRWEFAEDHQLTHLTLNDHRAAPARRRQR